MSRPGRTLPVPSATTVVVAVAIALIAGIALLNNARVGTTIPPGVYLPGASTGTVTPPAHPGTTGGSGPASPGGNRGPEAARTTPSSVARTGNSTSRPPATVPSAGETYRGSGGDTQVSTVAPNYPVNVSSDEQPASDGSSSGTPSTTTGSTAVVDH